MCVLVHYLFIQFQKTLTVSDREKFESVSVMNLQNPVIYFKEEYFESDHQCCFNLHNFVK